MPRKAKLLVPRCPHHIVQRGHNRQALFLSDEGYQCYLDKTRILISFTVTSIAMVWGFSLVYGFVGGAIIAPLLTAPLLYWLALVKNAQCNQ
ncbi:MAG: hypothetical protein BMS9Abin36_1905 [Gammaproteobacteria bacterium]|nr:MAG: hypothetical protein BMS9Abin36_1905 [Gammaproteobacteria bacterium]